MESEKGKQEWVGRAQNQKDVLHDRYAGLGLGRAGGGGVDESDGSENPKNETRSRRRSLSRFLMDRDKDKDGVREKDKEKEKENEDYHQPHHPKEKEGSRSFMGSVRRISLVSVGVVGRHKKTKSGGGFIGGAGGGSPARIPPLPCSLPPVLASASQVSLRIHSTTNPGSGQRYTSSDVSAVDLRRAASLSSPNTGSSGDLASSSPTPVRSRPGSNSRPPSISSSTKRRRRTLSKSKSKPRKSEESQELSRDRVPKASLDIQQEREPSDLSEENDIPIPKTPTRATVAAAMAAVSSQQQPPLPAMPLLPPIELQPPSPPRTTTKRHIQRRSRAYTTNEFVEGLELEGLVGMPSTSVFFTPTRGGAGSILPLPPLSPSKLSPGKSPSQSQQSVSLGRSTAVNVVVAGDESAGLSLASGNGSAGAGAGAGGLPRRNSLGDLKIPARISQAQVGLRRDLGMVREFASNVEQLKELQTTYNTLVIEVQALLDTHIQLHQRVQRPVETSPPPVVPQTTSPNFFTQLKPRPKTRGRSNTNPTAGSTIHVPEAAVDSSSLDLAITSSQAAYKSLVEAFWKITSKYRISWECAELLIELGSGSGGGDVVMSAPPSAATTSVSAPVIQPHLAGTGEGKMSSLKGRERAITLAGDEPKHSTTPPPPPAHHETETQVQSQPSSVFVPITGSSSMPGGMQATIATNSGPPLASPPSTSWRASTGRHDLSQRQLVLLREILNNNVATASGDDEGGLGLPPLLASIPLVEDTAPASSPYYPSLRSRLVNRDWRWGDARNSTITLSEEQESEVVDESGRRDRKVEKKRRSGRLGMSGIRDLLRSLKKSHVEEPQIGNANVDEGQSGQHYHHHHHARLSPIVPTMHSTSSLSTESSIDNKSVQHQLQPQPQQQQQQQNRLPIPRIPSQIRRRGRSSTGPESMNKGPSSTSFTPSSFTVPKPSPRRPSLASIFRIGNSNSGKTRPASGIVHTGVGVGVEDPAGSSSSAFAASEHDLSAAQSSSTTTGTRADDSNSTGGEEEEDWDRMDSASDLDAASATAAAKALGAVDGPYDVSATVRGRNKFKSKADDRKRAGVSPYLQHQSSYDSDHHLPPPPVPPSSSSTGLGGFLARHSIIPKRSFSASQSSIWGTGGGDGQPQHSPNVPSGLSRHSNFEEHQQHTNVEPASLRISSSKSAPTTTGQSKLLNTSNLNFVSSSTPGASSSRPSSSRSTKFPHVNAKTGSVRSMPPHLAAASLLPSGFQGQPSPLSSLPDPKQAMIMTPENIKPLLENSKKVHVKLHECIAEIRALIDGAVAVSHIGVQTTATSTVPAS
ncbi:hypothetical protein BYT27DRAFT_6666418 [Phlegmacium glaucopus]|nr:hypothetical protein BYT27DRAFT_6666418 [Phlegmacium glaucopus]